MPLHSCDRPKLLSSAGHAILRDKAWPCFLGPQCPIFSLRCWSVLSIALSNFYATEPLDVNSAHELQWPGSSTSWSQ